MRARTSGLGPAPTLCWRSATPAPAWTNRCGNKSSNRSLRQKRKGKERGLACRPFEFSAPGNQGAVHVRLYRRSHRSSWRVGFKCEVYSEAVLSGRARQKSARGAGFKRAKADQVAFSLLPFGVKGWG